MGRPICLNVIEDLAIGASGLDILREFADAQLDEPSMVIVFELRESVDVSSQIKMGTEEVKPLGGASLQAAVGNLPDVPNDKAVVTMGKAGERIQVLGTNANAAAQELAVKVFIIAMRDIAVVPGILSNL